MSSRKSVNPHLWVIKHGLVNVGVLVLETVGIGCHFLSGCCVQGIRWDDSGYLLVATIWGMPETTHWTAVSWFNIGFVTKGEKRFLHEGLSSKEDLKKLLPFNIHRPFPTLHSTTTLFSSDSVQDDQSQDQDGQDTPNNHSNGHK